MAGQLERVAGWARESAIHSRRLTGRSGAPLIHLRTHNEASLFTP